MTRSVSVRQLIINDHYSDLIICCESKSDDIPQAIKSGQPWEFELRATNGAFRTYNKISSDSLSSYKIQNDKDSIADWETLIYQVLFNELPNELSNSIKLIATSDKDVDEDEEFQIQLGIYMEISLSIRQHIGSIQLQKKVYHVDEDEEEDDSYDLFNWTQSLQEQRDDSKYKLNETIQLNKTLQESIDKILKEQELLVIRTKQKDEHQLKVFTKILNDLQEKNRRLITGQDVYDDEYEDFFNSEHVNHAIEAVRTEEEKPPLKKPKIAKATPKVKKEVVKNANVKHEDPSPVKLEEQEFKASSIPSVQFKFSKDDEPEKQDEHQDDQEEEIAETQEDEDESEDEAVLTDEDSPSEQSEQPNWTDEEGD